MPAIGLARVTNPVAWDNIPRLEHPVKPRSNTPMSATSQLVLNSVLRVMHPVVRLLLRHGVSYPAFAAALKQVFVDAARAELVQQNMPLTDSAVTLLSGVHRRDVRQLTRAAPDAPLRPQEPLSLAAQVVARWMNDAAFLDGHGEPRALLRGSAAGGFDELVAGVSSDVRPKAMLDELQRLGAVQVGEQAVSLQRSGFAPRQGLPEMLTLLSQNLHDHLAAAVANVQGRDNFLEQAVFVDEISAESAARLQAVSVQAWQQAFKTVMAEAQLRFDHDARAEPPASRQHRARFGVYFFSDRES